VCGNSIDDAHAGRDRPVVPTEKGSDRRQARVKNRCVHIVRSAQAVLDRRAAINGIEWHWPTLPECMSMQPAMESGAEKVQREGACQPVERGWG
jgi:hypothetical protein